VFDGISITAILNFKDKTCGILKIASNVVTNATWANYSPITKKIQL
jgi:hypothetical protein